MTQVYGVQQTIAALKQIDPELLKQTRKDLKVAAEPIATSIRAYIPNQPPLRGFRHNGRTSWKPSGIQIKVKTDFSKRAFAGERSLVRIVVGGRKNATGMAALEIADMAGKVNKIATSGRTTPYNYKGTKRTHAKRGQGRAMIDYLSGSFSSPSRFVYRAAELHKAKVQQTVLESLQKVSKKVNNELLVK